MSRSIHTTRRDLEVETLWGGDGKRAQRLREQLQRKRSIKWNVREERHAAAAPPVPTSVEGLPVEELDRGPYMVYGATEEDVREVLRRLPAGSIDGLAGVWFSLARDAEEDEGDADPYTGRLGFEYVPGAWTISVSGRYRPHGAPIILVGDVVDPAHPMRGLLATLLRIHALMVLVHEVAHHVDHTRRVARGRWRADEEEKVEDYADTRMLEWTREVVLPYLEERHLEAVQQLLDWIERHGGVRLSLEMLADDPTDPMFRLFPCAGAVHRLMECVLEGMDPVDARAEFAEELWLCDLHDELATVLDGILAEAPDHRQALLTKSDLLRARERADDAEALIRWLIDADPEDQQAWERLARIHRDRFDWEALVGSASRLYELSDEPSECEHALYLRARALLGLGRLAGMENDLERIHGRAADALRACWLLASDRTREAFTLAETTLASHHLAATLYPELLAVRHAAAARLGRPGPPGEISDATLERLRRRGFGEFT